MFVTGKRFRSLLTNDFVCYRQMKIALRGQFFSEMWKHMSDVFKLMASGNIMNLIALSGNMKKDVTYAKKHVTYLLGRLVGDAFLCGR